MYTLKNRKELMLALGDASIPLDNNWAENAERHIAVGRKNFLFVQSEEAGKELALLYSLVVSCGRLGKNPTEYLTDVLRRIDDVQKSKLADLLPHRWQPPSKPPPSAPANIVNESIGPRALMSDCALARPPLPPEACSCD